MLSNLEKYKEELEQLMEDGGLLLNSMQKECYPESFEKAYPSERNYRDNRTAYY